MEKGRGFYISREDFEYREEGDLTSSFTIEEDYSTPRTFYNDLFSEQEVFVPLSIFSSQISTFQAVVKYLKEVEGLKYSEIAELTKRDQRSIWNTYSQAKNLNIDGDGNDFIPLSIFSDRTYSALESLVMYLKRTGLNYNEMALMLQRNYQTIYTTYRNARRKQDEN